LVAGTDIVVTNTGDIALGQSVNSGGDTKLFAGGAIDQTNGR